MLSVKNLCLMQDGFRHSWENIVEMASFAATGRFNLKTLIQHNPSHSNLIAITRFEDGRQFIRDGFHRAVSVFLGRSNYELYEDEYFIEHLTYQRMMTANLSMKYYTPFDPRIEVRAADFGDFRLQVQNVIDKKGDPMEYIRLNRHVYAKPKMSHHENLEIFVNHWSQLNNLRTNNVASISV